MCDQFVSQRRKLLREEKRRTRGKRANARTPVRQETTQNQKSAFAKLGIIQHACSRNNVGCERENGWFPITYHRLKSRRNDLRTTVGLSESCGMRDGRSLQCLRGMICRIHR